MNIYFGLALRCARYENKIGTKRLSGYLGITENELRRFERGQQTINPRVLTRLLAAGIAALGPK